MSLCAFALVAALFVVQTSAIDYPYCASPNDLQPTVNASLQLQMVQIIFRHGDRTMLNRWPNDHSVWYCNLTDDMYPSKSSEATTESFDRIFKKKYMDNREVLPGNCLFGQLTGIGYDQHIALGNQLRRLYVDTYNFISSEYSSDEVWIRTGDSPRCVDSAMAQLIGLYPTMNGGSSLPVVDVYTIDSVQDNLSPNTVLCPALATLGAELVQQPAFVSFDNSFAPLKAQLRQLLANNPNASITWGGMMDALSALTCHNMSYPAGVTMDMLLQAYKINQWEYNYLLQNVTYSSYSIGTLYVEMLDRMTSLAAGTPQPKYLMYSAHDTSVAPFLAGLGLYTGEWPPYAAHAELELWSDTGKANWFVQAKPYGQAALIKGCSSVMCPIKEFAAIVASLTPTPVACHGPALAPAHHTTPVHLDPVGHAHATATTSRRA